jgi:transposase
VKDLSFFGKIYLSVEPVDFRKQAHGLAIIVEHVLKQNPITEKSLFVFTNKRRDAVKILYWDVTGFALWWKTLESEKFRWPKKVTGPMQIQAKELKWLLEGIDFTSIKKHMPISKVHVN